MKIEILDGTVSTVSATEALEIELRKAIDEEARVESILFEEVEDPEFHWHTIQVPREPKTAKAKREFAVAQSIEFEARSARYEWESKIVTQERVVRRAKKKGDKELRYFVDPRSPEDAVLWELGPISDKQLKSWRVLQRKDAIEVGPGWFWFQNSFHRTEDSSLTALDVKALILEKENQRRLKLEKAHAVMAMVENLEKPVGKRGRPKIPPHVQISVFQRDGGQCVNCGSKTNLEFDHMIPYSMGGADSVGNLQLMCLDCNRRKGATLG